MRTLILAGLMSGATALPLMAQPVTTPAHAPDGQTTYDDHWGASVDGRWQAGDRAPGGWAAYRTPVEGFILPGYWLQPDYDIDDHGAYGLPAPPPGYGWSRYYDDAVLSDQYGKVLDSRIHYDWDRHGGDRAERIDDRRLAVDDAVIGAFADGPIDSAGAVAEAPREDRYRADSARLRAERRLAREEARQYRDWTGRQRRLDGLAQEAGYSDYDHYRQVHDEAAGSGPDTGQPRRAMDGGPEPDAPHMARQALPAGAYIADGYYYPGATITTITIMPGDGGTSYRTETSPP